MNTMTASSSLRIAYQGESGAYSEQAAIQYFQQTATTTSSATPPQLNFHPCVTFAAMFEALASAVVDQAVVPIENSLAGTIHENLDLLLRHPKLSIVGELDFHVRHCLVAFPDVSIEDISTVQSHPMALSQCAHFLREKNLNSEVAYDTAGSAKLIRKQLLKNTAAIASERAALIYNLNILARDIQDEPRNFTRFLVLSTNSVPYVPNPPISYKSSIAFCLIDAPGILCRALSAFAVTDIDLCKIESRHIYTVRNALGLPDDVLDEQRWGYVFYVDLARHADEPSVDAALNHLQQITTFYRLLGAYPADTSLTSSR